MNQIFVPSGLPCKYTHALRGLSLIELLIVLAVFSISLSIIGPNISRFIAHNSIAAQLNHLNALIQRARILAINHQDTITLCPSLDFSNCSMDWNQGIIGFIDENRNNSRDEQEALLFASQKITSSEIVTGPRGPIRFHESGVNSSPATLRFCPQNADLTLARAIFVSLQGRTRLSKDTNNDGIHEKSPGLNLSCS